MHSCCAIWSRRWSQLNPTAQLSRLALALALTLLIAIVPTAAVASVGKADRDLEANPAGSKRPPGAVRLPPERFKQTGAVACGRFDRWWLPGELLSSGWFVSHRQQATNFRQKAQKKRKKSRKLKSRAKRQEGSKAKRYRAKAKKLKRKADKLSRKADRYRDRDQKQYATCNPNILLVITDDQAPGTMDVMPRTLEFFGEGGTEFAQGYVTQPLCCPSRASIFSGQYPHNHGVITNDGNLFDPDRSWQRYLHDAGYLTGMIGKYLNLIDNEEAPHFDYHSGEWERNDPEFEIKMEASALEFLARSERSDKQPWALVYSTRSPHGPYTVKPRIPQAIPPFNPTPSLNEADLSDKDPIVATEAESWDPSRSETIRTGHLEELQGADEALGTVYDELDRLGETSGTLAIFISDNGFLWGQHRLEKKNWPYLESVRVPFFARWPGQIAAGEETPRLVANIDIAPTILEAAGVAPSHTMDGRPLFGSPPREWLLLERLLGNNKAWTSLISAERQYVEWTNSGFVEDYDLAADPWQLEASNAPDPKLAAELEAARSCAGAGCP